MCLSELRSLLPIPEMGAEATLLVAEEDLLCAKGKKKEPIGSA